MARIASRPGRKAQPANQGRRVSLGLKVTPTIKNRLDAAAKESGRTQSQESEARLEASFLNQRLLDETLDIAYGRKNSAVLQLIAEVIRRASDHGAWIAALAGREEPANVAISWLEDPLIFEIVNRHIKRALEALRPPGDAPDSLIDVDGQDLSVIFDKAGAANVLDALIDPPNAVAGLADWATPVAGKLTPGLVDRIRAHERGLPATFSGVGNLTTAPVIAGKTIRDAINQSGEKR